VTARQSRLVDREGLSIRSDSSSQSSAESRACSGPNSMVTARMKAANSRSAMCTWSSYVESRNDDVVFTGSSACQAVSRSCHENFKAFPCTWRLGRLRISRNLRNYRNPPAFFCRRERVELNPARDSKSRGLCDLESNRDRRVNRNHMSRRRSCVAFRRGWAQMR